MTTEGITTGELSRQVAGVLLRFEHLATRLDESYVPKQLYELYRQGVDKALAELEASVRTFATKEALGEKVDRSELAAVQQEVTRLESRVKSLENNLQWIVRIVLTFVVVGVLGAVFVSAGLQK